MNKFAIELSDEQAERLRERAREANLTPERLLNDGIERWLTAPDLDFAEAAAYVLKKNRELYRRLA